MANQFYLNAQQAAAVAEVLKYFSTFWGNPFPKPIYVTILNDS